jgi:hypothetical protein
MKVLRICAILLLFACGDKEDPKPVIPEPTKVELLTAETWVLKTVNGGTPSLESIYKFKTNGTFSHDGYALFTGTWELTDGEKKIHLMLSGSEYEYEIKSLTENEFSYMNSNSEVELFKPQ